MALSTHRASTSRTSAECAPPRWKHDVFLSFRGEDTRRGFISHLDRALACWQAMSIFKDDRELEVGAPISLELLTAIEESYLAIIVLSPNYASSTWCLNELSEILECMEDTKRILPIFYDVDPSDVRKQTGSFAEAFTKHEERFSGDAEKLNRWRAALRNVANLAGLDSKNYKSEAELVDDIVKRVWKKVNPIVTLLDSEEKLVGIDFALDQLRLHLAPEENDVRFIGIWGMGGVGKTTLAKLVFERISHHFELSWFLSNVSEVSGKQGGLVNLQRQILFPILKENVAHVWDEGAGTFFTQKRLYNKKVLLILDDVDQLNQLKTLAGKKDWFGVGSRIIITTRDERLLVEHGIAIRYKVEVLKDDEALELFSQNAFKKNQPEEGFLELSRCFVHYAKGLPLALTTLGSSLYDRGQDTWKSSLDNLGKIHNPTIFHSLKVSYDRLEEIDKKILLDIACFHKGKDEEQVIGILNSIYNISSRIRIDVLIEKSLLIMDKFNNPNRVQMHDLIQEMAWKIVHLESRGDPCQFSRLWLRDDISHVFMHNLEMRAIEGIVLRLPKLEAVPWNCTKAFNEMHGLRLLDFDNVVFSSGPKFLPNSLRIMHWSSYPSKSLPSGFEPHLLSKLEMWNSKLVRLWDEAQDFPNLKYMDLSNSDKLTSIPDFTRIPNLEELDLEGCEKLGEVHSSIAVHKKLKVLILDECKSIKSLPSELEMDSLEFFSLRGCSKLKMIPEFGEHMQNLKTIYIHKTAIEQIPSSIEHLVGLVYLYISNCKSLLGLPSAICKLKSLTTLAMRGCSKVDKLSGELDLSGSAMREPLVAMKNLKNLTLRGSVASRDGIWCGLDWLFGIRKSVDPDPWRLVLSSLNRLGSLTTLDLSDCNIGEGAISDDIGCCLSSLKRLDLSGNNFVSLPSSIRFLSELLSLGLERCKRLEQLPDLPPKRPSLIVRVDDCTSLKRLSDPSKLSEGANVYDFVSSCVNCFRLVEEEGWIWINRIFAMISMATMDLDYRAGPDNRFVWPGSEIPEWFDNRRVGDSIIVELPLPPQTCSDWVGIALCVVFEDSNKYLKDPPYAFLLINCSQGSYNVFKVGQLESQHLWVFYLPRNDRWFRGASSSHRFSFEWVYLLTRSETELKTSFSVIKKCGARLVYQRDLEEFNQILKIPMSAALHASGDEEAAPIGSSGSGSSDDHDEPGIGCSNDDDEQGIGSYENEPGS